MNWLGYKNISKIILTTTILLILSNTLLISLFYYKNQMTEYDIALEQLKTENINIQKDELVSSVQNLIEMIEFKYSKDELKDTRNKQYIKQWIKNIKFDKNKSDYIFVYELLNKNGGDKFAKMIINPNRPDIEGKFISTNYTDSNGFAFRKKFLNDINKQGDSIVSYSYKKTNEKIDKKISYFKYYAPLNWIIAKGVYDKDIQKEIALKKSTLKQKITKQIKQNLLLFILFSIMAIGIAYIIGKLIKNIIHEKEYKVKKTTKALAVLNRDLDTKVKQEVEKNKAQSEILMRKSKFIALGETISLIAHQWRQPITELNAIILNLKLHHRLNKLDDTLMEKKSNEIETLLHYMSTTIDDFRTFFKPQKEKEVFFFVDSFQRVSEICSAMLNEHHINLVKNIDKELYIKNYQNELEQVVLNLITNAKDALVSDCIKDPIITINVYKKDKVIYLEVWDNAKGIDKNIQDKIFDPYFTTKEEANGTGIGLYMSKMIIEQNMGGDIMIHSTQKGSCFIISFHL